MKTTAPETVTLSELYALTGCKRGTFTHWAFAAGVKASEKSATRNGRRSTLYTRQDVVAIRSARNLAGKPLPPLPKGW